MSYAESRQADVLLLLLVWFFFLPLLTSLASFWWFFCPSEVLWTFQRSDTWHLCGFQWSALSAAGIWLSCSYASGSCQCTDVFSGPLLHSCAPGDIRILSFCLYSAPNVKLSFASLFFYLLNWNRLYVWVRRQRNDPGRCSNTKSSFLLELVVLWRPGTKGTVTEPNPDHVSEERITTQSCFIQFIDDIAYT